MLLALVGMALAGEFAHITVDEAQTYTSIVPLEAAEAPEGVNVVWFGSGGELTVVVFNERDTPIEIDWDRSAFTDAGRSASGVVPGTTRKMDAKADLPTTVVPPASRIEEAVIRESSVSLDEVEPLVSYQNDGGDVSVTLAFLVDGELHWLTQHFVIEVDEDKLRDLNTRRADAAADAAYQRELATWTEERLALVNDEAKYKRQMLLFGGLGLGAAVFMPAIGAVDEDGEFDPDGLAMGISVGGAPLGRRRGLGRPEGDPAPIHQERTRGVPGEARETRELSGRGVISAALPRREMSWHLFVRSRADYCSHGSQKRCERACGRRSRRFSRAKMGCARPTSPVLRPFVERSVTPPRGKPLALSDPLATF